MPIKMTVVRRPQILWPGKGQVTFNEKAGELTLTC